MIGDNLHSRAHQGIDIPDENVDHQAGLKKKPPNRLSITCYVKKTLSNFSHS